MQVIKILEYITHISTPKIEMFIFYYPPFQYNDFSITKKKRSVFTI